MFSSFPPPSPTSRLVLLPSLPRPAPPSWCPVSLAPFARRGPLNEQGAACAWRALGGKRAEQPGSSPASFPDPHVRSPGASGPIPALRGQAAPGRAGRVLRLAACGARCPCAGAARQRAPVAPSPPGPHPGLATQPGMTAAAAAGAALTSHGHGPSDPFYASPFGPFYRRHTPYVIQPEYRLHELNKRLQARTEESDNLWWDAFATEFFDDDASFTLAFCLEDGPKRYTIGRTLIPRYFRTIFEGGVTDLSYMLRHSKEAFNSHSNAVTLDCEHCTMVTHHGKPAFTTVCTDGRLILEFSVDEMRIRTWHFSIRQHRELLPRSLVAIHTQDPQSLEQLSKNVTRSGQTNVTLNYLRLCVILEPMQELMSRHKTYNLSPRDCLKTCLFQKWQRMVAPPAEPTRQQTSKRRKRKPSSGSTATANNTGSKKKSPSSNFSLGSQTEDPVQNNVRFWEELFLLKVNLEYLEAKLESLVGDQLMQMKDNINSLFHHCVLTLREDHQIRVVNALQTLCGLLRGVHQKNMPNTGFDIINILMGFDNAEEEMKSLMVSLDSLLCGDGSLSLKGLCLKLLLCLITVTGNISQNTILEYIMINSIFEAIIQILSTPQIQQHLGYDAVVLLALLVNYRKYESANPYIVKLSILDDEMALNGTGLVLSRTLCEYNRHYKSKEEEAQGGIFSTITNIVGNMFIGEAEEKLSPRTNESLLLALYEAVHLNRNFIAVLAHSHPEMEPATPPQSPSSPNTPTNSQLDGNLPTSDALVSTELPLDPNTQTSNLLITFLKYCSIVMQDTKDEHRLNSAKLCLIILTCIAEDQYANSFLHDDNMTFRVHLHRMPMRHRKKVVDKNVPSRPLACAVLDLMVEFMMTHMMKDFPMELYLRCVAIVQKLICYQKKCRVRLHYTWQELWAALISVLKFLLSHETVLLGKHNIFPLALQVVNLFNMFITYGDTFLPTPGSYDELYYEIIRMHQAFDNLYSMVLRHSTNNGQWKDPASKVTQALVNIRAIVNHFNPKIESFAAVNHISQLSEEQVLSVVRCNYDTLTLKLQDSLDHYERYTEQPREASFFTQLVRSISADVRRTLSLGTLSQEVLLKEFSTIA
uniref:Armadillo like helical domain containing 3 n=1 Tax=Eptatretus burgeri TaxID=7764 RepID=A0A8C4Q262_EPTBU